MAKNLILVQDSAGENVLVNIANIVRVSEHEERRLIEILAKEPVWDNEMATPYVTDELNKYYSTLTLEEFVVTYA